MNTIQTVFSVIYIAFVIIFIAIILLQKKRSSGLGAQMAGAGASNGTYWDKNKNNSVEGKLSKYTAICGVIYFISTLLMNFVW